MFRNFFSKFVMKKNCFNMFTIYILFYWRITRGVYYKNIFWALKILRTFVTRNISCDGVLFKLVIKRYSEFVYFEIFYYTRLFIGRYYEFYVGRFRKMFWFEDELIGVFFLLNWNELQLIFILTTFRRLNVIKIRGLKRKLSVVCSLFYWRSNLSV